MLISTIIMSGTYVALTKIIVHLFYYSYVIITLRIPPQYRGLIKQRRGLEESLR